MFAKIDGGTGRKSSSGINKRKFVDTFSSIKPYIGPAMSAAYQAAKVYKRHRAARQFERDFPIGEVD